MEHDSAESRDGCGSPATRAFRNYCATRDARHLGDVFRLLQRELVRVALRVTRDDALAEDAVQATFVDLMRRPDRFRGESSSVEPWIRRIAQNKALWLARQARRVAPPDAVETAGRPAATPIEEVIRWEDSRRIRELLSRAPEDARPALRLHLLLGWSDRAIAAALGEPLGTVKSRLRNGKRALRRALDRNDTGPESV